MGNLKLWKYTSEYIYEQFCQKNFNSTDFPVSKVSPGLDYLGSTEISLVRMLDDSCAVQSEGRALSQRLEPGIALVHC